MISTLLNHPWGIANRWVLNAMIYDPVWYWIWETWPHWCIRAHVPRALTLAHGRQIIWRQEVRNQGYFDLSSMRLPWSYFSLSREVYRCSISFVGVILPSFGRIRIAKCFRGSTHYTQCARNMSDDDERYQWDRTSQDSSTNAIGAFKYTCCPQRSFPS